MLCIVYILFINKNKKEKLLKRKINITSLIILYSYIFVFSFWTIYQYIGLEFGILN